MRIISSYGQVWEARGRRRMLAFSVSAPSGPLLRTTSLVSRQPIHSHRVIGVFPARRWRFHPPQLADETLLHERHDTRTKNSQLQAVQSPTCCRERLRHLGAPVEVFADDHAMQRCQYYQHCLGCSNTAQLDADQVSGPSAARGWQGRWAR